MRLPSPSHTFSQVPSVAIPRSRFDRSHGHKTTIDSGYLYPIFVDEVLPGDTFKVSLTAFARLATPLHPVMDNIYMSTFFFFVPNRLVWENWERFNGAQDNPGDSVDFLIPTVTVPGGGYAEGSLWDYFGLPTGVDNVEHSALFSRAYNLIWNEWFRDQNLQDSVVVDIDDGPDTASDYVLLRRGRRHDYFTSGLPWPQKGDSVDIPLGTSAPVVAGGAPTFAVGGSTGVQLGSTAGTNPVRWSTSPAATGLATWDDPNLSVDLTNATAATVNQLRQAFQVQKLLERDARGGTRYPEVILSHFGVRSPDARLQRPEYLGGGQSRVNVAPVAQTSESGTTPLGELGAFGTVVLNRHGFTQSFTEHGVVIGLVQVRSDLTYQQGLNRMWSRQTRYDFYWPTLAHIGEQPILNKEIYFSNVPATDDAVFAYQERYAEYRYKPSIVTAAMRSNAAASLDTWHLALDFPSTPVLNDSFIQDDPPIDRVLAVSDEPQFIFDGWFDMQCARPMPLYGVPGNIDRF